MKKKNKRENNAVVLSGLIVIVLSFCYASISPDITGFLFILGLLIIMLSKHISALLKWKFKLRATIKRPVPPKIPTIEPIQQLGVSKPYKFKKNSQNRVFTIEDDYFMFADLSFLPDEIQWFGRDKNSNFLRMDVKVNDEWYTINSNLDDDSLEQFLKRVPDKLKQSRYMYRPEVRTYVGKKAYITTQNLQGIFEKHESVELHVTPLWMVILHNGRVIQQHFIDDIADIRSTKHPTDLDDDMQLLTFEVSEEAFAYALKDKTFVTRLSDATRDGIDSEATRKKKKQQEY